ncbi:MAG: SMR family transporter [Verrucomicrobiales bacterium]|nr:SMR family transporter [Verrucomicrobiales bacterium]
MTKALLFILLSSSSAVTCNALVRKTLERRDLKADSITELIGKFVGLFKEPLIWVGCCCFAFAVGCWIIALSKMKLSVAYPVQTALVFVLTGLVSALVFQEQISPKMMIGYILILGGISLVTV